MPRPTSPSPTAPRPTAPRPTARYTYRRIASTLAATSGLALVAVACGGGGDEPAATSSDGEIAVFEPWVRATPPGVTEAAIYLRLENSGDDDRLLGARAERCISVPVHATTIDDQGVARMRELDGDELDLPDGGSLELSPNGIHLMCVELDGALVAGDAIDVDLVFERHPTVRVVVPIEAP